MSYKDPKDIARLMNEDCGEPGCGKFDYPKAGQNAPESVRQAIDEFHQLPDEQKTDLPLLYHILGSGTPDYKMSKEDSEYTDTSEVEGQTCENCKSAYQRVYNQHFICSQITGGIEPAGWCRLWKPGK